MHAIRACWVILLAIGGKKSMLDCYCWRESK